MPEFNLIDEKWIPCVMSSASDGDFEIIPESLSLQDALLKAHKINQIVGENPLITISIYRLLLAILHDIFQGPKDVDKWEMLWNKESFDKDSIENYFKDNYENFYLFHDDKPFYQTTKMDIQEKFIKPIWKFFLEGEGFATTFEHTNIDKPISLSLGEAARYLIAFQNFDVSGLQTYVHEKGMKQEEINLVKPADACLLNKCAVGIVKGKNLFKTLMLNLTQYNRTFGIPFPKGKITDDPPIWKNNETIDPKNDRSPRGYLDLMTWQSRQIKLILNDENKTIQQVVVMKGNQLSEIGELHKKEQLTAFRKDKKRGWLPVSFQKDKALWRNSFSIFHSVDGASSRPEILDWLNDLVANGKLESDSVFPLDFFGLAVDPSKSAKPLFWRHERLPMPLKYLSDFELCNELREALKFAESTAFLLNDGIYRTSTLFYLPESRFDPKAEKWFKPFCSEETRKSFDEYKKGKTVKDKFKVSKGKPVGEIPLLVKTLAPDLRYWSRLENPFRKHLLELAKGKSGWKSQRENWANEILKRTVFLAFSEAVQNLGNSPNALRAVSISQSWLEAEFNRRKKKFLNFEVVDNDEQNTNEDEEEETE